MIPSLLVLTQPLKQDSSAVLLHFDLRRLRVLLVCYPSFLCRQQQLAVAHRATLAACYDSHAESLYLCCSNGSAPTPLTFIIYGCSQTQTSAYSPVGSSLCLLFPLPFFYSFLSHCLGIATLAFVALIFQAKAKNIETVATRGAHSNTVSNIDRDQTIF